MFTGIIQHTGRFLSFRDGKSEMALQAPAEIGRLGIGESLAVNGVCLSLVSSQKNNLSFNLSPETLARTNLGHLHRGDILNLERPLTLSSSLSGHLVTGHIDGMEKVLRIIKKGTGVRVEIGLSPALRPYFIPKGSVAVNGASLTVARLGPSSFEVELIPITLTHSNLGTLKRGDAVNVECDILGKYLYNWYLQKK